MVWNYYDADILNEASPVTVTIKNISAKKILLQHYRIDKDHSNAYEAWKKMGSPQNVTDEEYRQLEQAGQLQLLNLPEWIIQQTEKWSFIFSYTARSIASETDLPIKNVSLCNKAYLYRISRRY
jgi:xylan 1,4-beta-xylosidase